MKKILTIYVPGEPEKTFTSEKFIWSITRSTYVVVTEKSTGVICRFHNIPFTEIINPD